jgi:hypothetical protein
MRVEATRQAASTYPDFNGAFEHDHKNENSLSESRALVVTETAAASQTSPVYREAAFLAHLIATKGHAPQTRERRRAEPAEALAAYRTVAALAAV